MSSRALQKFWDTAPLGVRDEPPVSQLEGHGFLKNIHFDDKEGRYEVRLPWKDGHFPINDDGQAPAQFLPYHAVTQTNRKATK